MTSALPACEAFSPLFDAERRPSDFAKQIDIPAGSFRCEHYRVSARSRGLSVQDDEILARIIVAPRDMKEGGPFGLGDTAVSEMYRLGLSTLRVNEVDISAKIEQLARFLLQKAADATPVGEEVFCAGVLEFACGAARHFRLPDFDKRIIGVYESPEDNYPNHSDVLQAANLFESNTKRKLAAQNFLAKGDIVFYPAREYKRADISDLKTAGRRVVDA